jgi:hypothetical protein
VVLKSGDSAAIARTRAQLESAIADWNTSLATNTAMLCVYFDSAHARIFSKQIAPTFLYYSNLLKNKSRNPRITEESIRETRFHLQLVMSWLILRMADRIRESKTVVQGEANCEVPTTFNHRVPELTDSAQAALDEP